MIDIRVETKASYLMPKFKGGRARPYKPTMFFSTMIFADSEVDDPLLDPFMSDQDVERYLNGELSGPVLVRRAKAKRDVVA